MNHDIQLSPFIWVCESGRMFLAAGLSRVGEQVTHSHRLCIFIYILFPVALSCLHFHISSIYQQSEVQFRSNIFVTSTNTKIMASPASINPIPPKLQALLKTAQLHHERVAVLTCGLTGSGKSTLSRAICSQYPSFTRLSIDAIILEKHKVYELDYPAEKYGKLQEEAEEIVKKDLKEIVSGRKGDVVLDLSFYCREWRDEYREMIEKDGEGSYKVVLVVFKPKGVGQDSKEKEEGLKEAEEVLWERVEARRVATTKALENGEAVEGMSVAREQLGIWLRGFEWPVNGNEGTVIEILIE